MMVLLIASVIFELISLPLSIVLEDVRVEIYIAHALIQTAALGFCVLHMRHTIQKTNFVRPNERLVMIHLINFTVWEVLFITD